MENYFISINVPKEIGESIHSKLEGQFIRVITGKSISREKYHITIKFFGDLNSGKLEKIKEDLSKVEFEKFNIRIGKLGFFDKGRHGILWAAAKSELLKQFVKEVWGIVGWSSRKFLPHITIMRTKRIFDLKKLNNIIFNLRFGNLEFDVDKFYLMKSISDKDGSRYEIVKEYNLN